MLRALLPLFVPVLAVALGGLAPVPRILTMSLDTGGECRPAVGQDLACAAACGGCPIAADAANPASAAASAESAGATEVGDDGRCVCCVCGIGVPASAPALVIPGECSVEDARPVSLLTSVDREPTSPPPEERTFVSS